MLNWQFAIYNKLEAMIFALSTDDRTLQVFNAEAEAIGYAEGIDVEAGVWRFFDSCGAPLEAVFTKPNTGRFLVASGKYYLRPAAGVNLIECLGEVAAVEAPAPLNTISAVRERLASNIAFETDARKSGARPST
jgi:hypothetical protein